MKKTTLILTIFSVACINAQVLNLKLKDNITKEISSKKEDNSFLIARQTYENGDYKKALELFENIKKKAPRNLRVQLEIAQCYVKLEEYDKAKEIFNSLLDKKLPKTVRDNIFLRLQNIEQNSTKNSFKIETFASILYDSNIDNSSENDIYSVYVPILGPVNILNENKKRSDKALELAAIFNHTYKVNKNFFLENKLTAYTQKYSKYSEKSINLLSLSLAPAFYFEKSKFSIKLYKDLIQLNNSSYQDNLYIKPEFFYNLSKNLVYKTSFKWNKKEYKNDIYKDRNSYEYTYSNSLINLSETFGLNQFTINLSKEEKRDGIRTDVDNKSYSFEYTNRYPLKNNILLSNSLGYKKINYDETDVNFLSKRSDRNLNYSLELTKTFTNNLSVGLNYNYTDKQSNHSPFEYDKHITKLFLFYPF
ncbi:tetratricopeptide repeat protein [Halarcobacter sp.]|uniref:tetratricopeptide repeat protein n=1 Tax=Halarcobacter sp. TaxID=2321133 RepID=UPI002AAAF0F3|nr:tetratricopeptide repeat protein [Halarcobacter sp.]